MCVCVCMRVCARAGLMGCSLCPRVLKHRLQEQHEEHERRTRRHKERASWLHSLPQPPPTRVVPRPDAMQVGLGLSLHVEPWDASNKRRGCVVVDDVIPGMAAQVGGIQVRASRTEVCLLLPPPPSLRSYLGTQLRPRGKRAARCARPASRGELRGCSRPGLPSLSVASAA